MATPSVTPNAAPDTGAAPVTPATPAAPVQSNADRALEAFRASDPNNTPAQPMPAGAAPLDPNAPPVDPAVAQPDPLEGLKENPRVIELLAAEEQHKAFQEALQGLPYTVESPQELKAQLGDASMLYDIVSGKRAPSELLEVMMANNHWTPEQQNKVLSDLAQYISQKTGQPVAAAAAGQFTDPIQKELAYIKGKLSQREQAEQQQKDAAEQTRVQGTFNKRIDELCKDFPKDAGYYSKQVAASIVGNQQILAQIAKGNFAQVNKLFAEARNADVERYKEWSNGLVEKNKTQQKELPKQPNGAVAPVAGAPVTFKNEAERQEHMLKQFRGQA